MMNKKSILFITGTRADYGKMKSIMKTLDADPHFEVYIFVGGMHLLEKFGNTYMEVEMIIINMYMLPMDWYSPKM